MAASSPSLEDFCHFHGMLCSPSTAQQCIRAFTGTILFMPFDFVEHHHHHYPSSNKNNNNNNNNNSKSATTTSTSSITSGVASFDCTAYNMLNVASYYALVIFSLTGLWTLCGQTKFLMAREIPEDEKVGMIPSLSPQTLRAETDPHHLVVPQPAIDYFCAQNPSAKGFYVKRQFEYDFVGLLSVVMFHIACRSDGKLRLIEVYKVHHPVVRYVARHVFGILGVLAKWTTAPQCRSIASLAKKSP